MVLACFIETVPGATWARTALIAHARVLALSSFYRGTGNHALGQDRALIVAGCVLRRSDWVRLGVARLTRLVVGSVDSQGVTNEQAVFYQLYNYQGYHGAADRLRQCGRAVPSALRRIRLMPELLAHATLPDRSYWMLGDTSRLRAATLRGTSAEFAATGGASGVRPRDVFRAFGAGFAFGRTGWGERRAYARRGGLQRPLRTGCPVPRPCRPRIADAVRVWQAAHRRQRDVHVQQQRLARLRDGPARAQRRHGRRPVVPRILAGQSFVLADERAA